MCGDLVGYDDDWMYVRMQIYQHDIGWESHSMVGIGIFRTGCHHSVGSINRAMISSIKYQVSNIKYQVSIIKYQIRKNCIYRNKLGPNFRIKSTLVG